LTDRGLSRCSPEAVIDPSGNASAAATLSRSGVSCPIWSTEGGFARISSATPLNSSRDLGTSGIVRKIGKCVKLKF
jgi:hypothetical protein